MRRRQGWLACLWQHRELVQELTKREFLTKYLGSFGGVFWSFIQPLFLLSIYTVVFGLILQGRWGSAGSTTDFSLLLFAGLIIFNAFAECTSASPILITSNPNFVKKVVFPLELLAVVHVTKILIHAGIAVLIWFCGYIVIVGIPKITAIWLPIVFISFLPVLLGLSWFLSAIGIIVKDTPQFTGIINHTLLFLTPIFYSIDAVPSYLQKLLACNPLTFIVEQMRLVLFYGQKPALINLSIYFILASLFSWSALGFFRRVRPLFADLV